MHRRRRWWRWDDTTDDDDDSLPAGERPGLEAMPLDNDLSGPQPRGADGEGPSVRAQQQQQQPRRLHYHFRESQPQPQQQQQRRPQAQQLPAPQPSLQAQEAQEEAPPRPQPARQSEPQSGEQRPPRLALRQIPTGPLDADPALRGNPAPWAVATAGRPGPGGAGADLDPGPVFGPGAGGRRAPGVGAYAALPFQGRHEHDRDRDLPRFLAAAQIEALDANANMALALMQADAQEHQRHWERRRLHRRFIVADFAAADVMAAAEPPPSPLADPAPYPPPYPADLALADAVLGDPVAGVLENGDLLKAVLGGLSVVELCRVAGVSRLWRRVADDRAFWRSVDLLDRRITPDQALRLCRRQRGVIEELRLRGSSLASADAGTLARLAPNLDRLTTLELKQWMLTDRSLAQLSSGLPSLRELVLRDSQIVAAGGTGAQSDATLSHPGLTSLDLSHVKSGRLALACANLTRMAISACQLAALSATGATLPRLSHLTLAATPRLSDSGLLAAVTSLTALSHLDISDASVPEDLLRGAARSLEQLATLELTDCGGVSLSPARGTPVFAALRRLVVRRCESLSSASAGLLLEGCAGLEELALDGCGQVAALAVTLPVLRSLSVRGCRLLNSLELRCRRLEELSLGSLEPGGPGGAVLRHVMVASDSLRSIAWRHLPSLEDLTLDCPGLTSLSLTDCDSLTDKIFDMLTDVQEITLAPPLQALAQAPAARGTRGHATGAGGGGGGAAAEPQPLVQAAPAAQQEPQQQQRERGLQPMAMPLTQLGQLVALPPPQPQLKLGGGRREGAFGPRALLPAAAQHLRDRDRDSDIERAPGRATPRRHLRAALLLHEQAREWERERARVMDRRQRMMDMMDVDFVDLAAAADAAEMEAAAAIAEAEAAMEAAMAEAEHTEFEVAEEAPGPGPVSGAPRVSGPHPAAAAGAAGAAAPAAAVAVGPAAAVPAAAAAGAAEAAAAAARMVDVVVLAGDRADDDEEYDGFDFRGRRSAERRRRRRARAAGAGGDGNSNSNAGSVGANAAPSGAADLGPGGSPAGGRLRFDVTIIGSGGAIQQAAAAAPPPEQPQIAAGAELEVLNANANAGSPGAGGLRRGPAIPASCAAEPHLPQQPPRRTALWPGQPLQLPQPLPAEQPQQQLPPAPQLQPQPALQVMRVPLLGPPQVAAPPPLSPPPAPPQPQAQAQLVSHAKMGGCPRLKELRLEGCEGLRHARLRHGRLAAMSLRGCRGLVSLRLSCPALGSLLLEECGELASVALAPAGLASLSLGACCALRDAELACSSLEQLSLKGCGSLHRVALDCPRLRELDATFCGGLTDEALASALSSRPPLVSLVLSVCCSLGPAVPGALAGLAGLRHLDLSYSCVSRLGPLLSGCTGLTALCLGSCRELEAEGEELLGLLPDKGHALPHLSSLDVSYCPLSPRVVVPLVRGLTHLTHLALNGCPGADEGIWRSAVLEEVVGEEEPAAAAAAAAPPPAAQAGSVSQLEKLSLVRCSGLTSLCLGLVPEQDGGAGGGAGVGGVGAGSGWRWPAGGPPPRSLLGPPWRPVGCVLSGLRSLRLGLSGVQAVALSLPHLTHLDLNGCSALRRLELRCPALTELHLQACCALPADLWVPLLGALGGNGDGRGLAVLDAQHAGLFGEAVAATLASAAVMEAAAEGDVDPGPGGSKPGPSGGAASVAAAPRVPADGAEPRVAAEGAAGGVAVGAAGGSAGAGDGVRGSGSDWVIGVTEGGVVVSAAPLLAAREQPWWLLPRCATVLACGADCKLCGRRTRRALLGLS